MADSHSSGDYSDVVSRRKFVSLAGTTGAAAVAGCLSGDGGGNAEWNAEGPFDYEDESIWFQTATGSFEINTFQYNPTTGWNIPHSQFGLFAPWTKYLMGPDEFVPWLVTDWEHSDNSFVLTVSDEFTWGSSGETITAEDLALQLDIQINSGDAIGNFIDDYEATSDTELVINYPEGTRQDFVTYATLDRNAAFAPSIWEGEGDNESPGGVEVTEPDPSGPLALTATESNYHQYEPRNKTEDWEDDPVAGDHFNWNGYRLGYRSSNNAFHESLIAQELDGVHSLFASPNTISDFPESIRQIQIPGLFGVGIWPDHTSDVFSNREVRQALYWSLDRQAIITNIGESTKIAHPTPTGLTANSIETYLGDVGSSDDFNTYTLDTDQAESLLSEAGYSPGDINETLVYPSSWSDWASASQSVVDQLTDAGWNIEGEGRDGGPGGYAEDLTGGEFNLCAHQHTPGGLVPRQNIPYFALDWKIRNSAYDIDGHFAGYDPEEVDLGDTTVNIEDSFSQLETAPEGEREGLIRDLARVVNIDVPCIILMEKYEQSFIDQERFDIPEKGASKHVNAVWPLWWLPQVEQSLETATDEATNGLMKARTY